jgi:hypothetical protein
MIDEGDPMADSPTTKRQKARTKHDIVVAFEQFMDRDLDTMYLDNMRAALRGLRSTLERTDA